MNCPRCGELMLGGVPRLGYLWCIPCFNSRDVIPNLLWWQKPPYCKQDTVHNEVEWDIPAILAEEKRLILEEVDRYIRAMPRFPEALEPIRGEAVGTGAFALTRDYRPTLPVPPKAIPFYDAVHEGWHLCRSHLVQFLKTL